MRQSNLYIILYAVAITVVCGGLLAFASQSLKPLQDANVELERKQNILSTVMEIKDGDDINKIYSERVKELVIDFNGNVKEGVTAASVIIAAEYKKKPEDRLLPVYEFRNQENPENLDNVVLPIYGFGLWNDIWGFARNGVLYVMIQGNFTRVTFIGNICHFVADVTTYDTRYNNYS
ncbi:MAG: hypothetical protein MUF39_00710, partial [Cyclobacteriaceae bacterium]|nr:hypothetical protein [Cyclobacteriaceae bacterium]